MSIVDAIVVAVSLACLVLGMGLMLRLYADGVAEQRRAIEGEDEGGQGESESERARRVA